MFTKKLSNTNLFLREKVHNQRRDEAAHGGEEIDDPKDTSSKIRRQILCVLSTRHCGSSIEAQRQSYERDAVIRIIINPTEGQQQQPGNDVSCKENEID